MRFLLLICCCVCFTLPSIFCTDSDTRYFLYDVNPGEGFNLRRDVFVRVANLVRFLNEKEKWTLVLPPWGRIYHWYSSPQEAKIRWSQYFNIESLRLFIPVMEFEEFKKVNGAVIDEVYYLQMLPYKESEGKGNLAQWEERYEKEKCASNYHGYYEENGKWRGWFFGYEGNVYSRKFECLSLMMDASLMTPFLWKETKARSVMFDRAEILIHGRYSEWSPEYWTGRRSLVFSERLHNAAVDFLKQKMPGVFTEGHRASLLEYRTDWRHRRRDVLNPEEMPAYLAVHLRRMDFVRAHADAVPSLRSSAEQALSSLRHRKLTHLFVASDAPEAEMEAFKEHFPPDIRVFRFDSSVGNHFTDGCLAIIDQILCSLARVFIGTRESTFSFRIHEEREIRGMPPRTTFNSMCLKSDMKCRQPTVWRIQYEPDFTLAPVEGDKGEEPISGSEKEEDSKPEKETTHTEL